MEPAAWPGVFREGRDLFTVNARPGISVYGERRVDRDGVEYRGWDPFRSKLAALLLRGPAPAVPARVERVLYLGASHGTTVSHVSDLWPSASIFAVEKSPASFAPLLALARERANLLPLLADAQLPERYQADVGLAEVLYQDVAQRSQAAIFAENARACLAPGGLGLLMLKIRSVTQRLPSAQVVRDARREIEAAGLPIRGEIPLAPFSREHVALVTGGPRTPSSAR
ncbi:MAG TPA: fibrillarin-like rRNA/tRNA 2'-O-methyltransferase [Thermoplasmata archaeon]|nr:fibrillarin-like rRNA/tRNA 2'-O-methyltransferase [Thermoplasmata archaeon]